MASDYGLNFGFRRSDESMRVSEGRFKTPVGSALRLGTAVEINPASAGFLKVAAANVAPVTGVNGLLLQELEFERSIYDGPSDPSLMDSFQMGVAKANRLSVITSGAGVKVWFKNTAAQTRADGRVISAVDLVDFANDGAGAATTLAVGDKLGWSGTKWVKTAATVVTNAVMTITDVNTTAKYLEAVLLA